MLKHLAGASTVMMVLALATPAAAQGPGSDPSAMLAKADANGDGAISWDEMVAMRTDLFERLDRNGDGVADTDDRPRFKRAAAKFDAALERMISQFDTNADGALSLDELIEGPAPAFDVGDGNGDKVLSADELAALKERATERRAE